MKTSYNEACARDCSTLEKDLALCEKAGFDYIEIRLDLLRGWLKEHTVEQLKEFFKTHRLKPHAINAVYLHQGMLPDETPDWDDPAMQDFKLACEVGSALNITHASVPPTPGPLAVIAQFGDTIDLGTYILFAIAMGIPLMVLIGIMSRIVGRKWYKVVDENGEIVDVAPENIEEYARISSQSTVPELDPNESYPSVVMSFAPIFVPVILILASTFTSMMYKGDPTPVTEIIGFLGSPVIAISISLLVSIYGLAGNKSRQEVLDCLERGVKSCGTVILITGAGGAFGNIIKSSGIGDVIANGLASTNMPILLLPFLMAAILKLVLGSGTVAMTTTATICAPILMQIPGANMMYCAYAACIGSQVFSLHNDSFFWVLTRTFKFDKLDVQILGYEGMQFIWSWVGFGLLCIVNAVF